MTDIKSHRPSRRTVLIGAGAVALMPVLPASVVNAAAEQIPAPFDVGQLYGSSLSYPAASDVGVFLKAYYDDKALV